MADYNKAHIPLLHKKAKAITIPVINGLAKNKLANPKPKIPVAKRKTAELNYEVLAERLTGWIGDEVFDEKVFSGGGRGHRKVSADLSAAYLHNEGDSLISKMWSTQETKDRSGN